MPGMACPILDDAITSFKRHLGAVVQFHDHLPEHMTSSFSKAEGGLQVQAANG